MLRKGASNRKRGVKNGDQPQVIKGEKRKMIQESVRRNIAGAWSNYLWRKLDGKFICGSTWNMQRHDDSSRIKNTEIEDILYEEYGEDAPTAIRIGFYRRIATHWGNDFEAFRNDKERLGLYREDDVRVAMGENPNHKPPSPPEPPSPPGETETDPDTSGGAQLYAPVASETLRTLRGLHAPDKQIRIVAMDILRENNVDHYRHIAQTYGYSWGIS
jgi:hypothetical protein